MFVDCVYRSYVKIRIASSVRRLIVLVPWVLFAVPSTFQLVSMNRIQFLVTNAINTNLSITDKSKFNLRCCCVDNLGLASRKTRLKNNRALFIFIHRLSLHFMVIFYFCKRYCKYFHQHLFTLDYFKDPILHLLQNINQCKTKVCSIINVFTLSISNYK